MTCLLRMATKIAQSERGVFVGGRGHRPRMTERGGRVHQWGGGLSVRHFLSHTHTGSLSRSLALARFRSFMFFELSIQADTSTGSAETPCFLSDHIKPPFPVQRIAAETG